jgi:hypothetical protein
MATLAVIKKAVANLNNENVQAWRKESGEYVLLIGELHWTSWNPNHIMHLLKLAFPN